ncbi:MAG: TVP38/TMEM64 family protein [Clostridia bacterium]|nr:TVP38/TMEM64 family protein [Clostridia bacterium]
MKKETRAKIWKICVVLAVVAIICLAIYLPLKLTGALEKINSAESLKEVILSWGAYGYILFFVIQFLQVVFLPIPAAVTTVAGTLVFGVWATFGLSLVAVILASAFSFFLGRKLGRKIVVWVAGEKDTEKWSEKLSKGKYVFFLMMLLPVFPDDILCMLVGATTNMTWKFFLATNFITRPIGIAFTCFLGSGVIPFTGWWIALWAMLALACVVLFVLTYKYQPQIEAFILKLAKKFERKKKQSQETETPPTEKQTKKEELPTEKTTQTQEISTEENKEE